MFIKNDQLLEKCNGCYFSRHDEVKKLCRFRRSFQNALCPCIECIIKVCCSERCEKRIDMLYTILDTKFDKL